MSTIAEQAQAVLRANHGPAVLITATVGIAISTLALVLRLYTRIRLVRRSDASDAIITFAWLLAALFTVCLWWDVHFGIGRYEIWFIVYGKYQYLEEMLKVALVSIVIYYPMISSAKISILLQYIQLFNLSYPRLVYGCWSLLWAQALQTILACLISAFSCNPTAYFWDRSIPNGYCLNWSVLLFFNAAFNIVTDIIVVVIPIVPVRKLQMPRRQKWIICIVFAVGGLGCIMSILRLQSVYQATKNDGSNVTWELVDIGIWSSIEANVGIVCACLTTLRPLIVKMFPGCLLDNTTTRSRTLPGDGSHPMSELQDFSAGESEGKEAYEVEIVKAGSPTVVSVNERGKQLRLPQAQDDIERRATVTTLPGEEDYHKFMRT